MTARRWQPLGIALLLLVGAASIFAGAGRAAVPPVKGDHARVELVPRIESRAKADVLARADLPTGWLVDPLWKPAALTNIGPGFQCGGHTADASALVVQGAWSSKFYRRTSQEVWLGYSLVYVFATPGQAEHMYDYERPYLTRYCQFAGQKKNGYELASLKLVPVAHVADEELDVQTLETTTSPTSGDYLEDFVVLRRGPILETLILEAEGKLIPASLKAALITRFAARART